MDKKTSAALVDARLTVTLEAVSVGDLSIMEAAKRLELPDAGHLFTLLGAHNLQLPRLEERFVSAQSVAAQRALDECRVRS